MQSNLSIEDMGDNIKVRELLSEAKNDFRMAHSRHDDFDYYICLCALFPPMRNIIKHWNSNQELFLQFVKRQGELGIHHLIQALVLYFCKSKYHNDLLKYAPMFLKKLIDEDYLSYSFLTGWEGKEITLDKFSKLKKRPTEKTFLDAIKPLIEYLK